MVPCSQRTGCRHGCKQRNRSHAAAAASKNLAAAAAAAVGVDDRDATDAYRRGTHNALGVGRQVGLRGRRPYTLYRQTVPSATTAKMLHNCAILALTGSEAYRLRLQLLLLKRDVRIITR